MKNFLRGFGRALIPALVWSLRIIGWIMWPLWWVLSRKPVRLVLETIGGGSGTAVYTDFNDLGAVEAEITKYELQVRDGRRAQRLNTVLIVFYAALVGALTVLAVNDVRTHTQVWFCVIDLVLAVTNVWITIRFMRQGSWIAGCRVKDAEMLRILRSVAEVLAAEQESEES